MAVFDFKEFSVCDDNCAMKIGTDSILLGSWIDKKMKPKNILDIGSGSGILSLMCAQKFPESKIIAVELDENACKDSELNFANSKFNNDFDLKNQDFCNFETTEKFDLIVSNPPYFSDSFLPNDMARSNARHNFGLSLEVLAQKVTEFLSNKGFFYVVFPFENFKNLVFELGRNGLFLFSKCEVKNSDESQIKRVLACFSKEYTSDIFSSNLTIRDIKGYSKEFISSTREFYLDKAYFK